MALPVYRAAALWFCVFTLGACAVGEDYSRPEIATDPEWHATSVFPGMNAPTSAIPLRWWESWNDPALNTLVETTLRNNNDLKRARARIAEARANERLAQSGLFPQIDGVASRKRGTMGGAFGDELDTSRTIGAQGRWEIDVFGATRRRSEAAAASIEATEAEFAQTRLELIAETVRAYVQLRSLQQQQALTQRNLDLQGNTLTITRAQREAQFVSDLDVSRAQAQVKLTQARLPQLKADAYAAANRLAVLTGQRSSALLPLFREAGSLPSPGAYHVATLPLEVIRQRPDVKAAERRLAEATALKAAAFADFFPKITLDGFFGEEKSALFGSTNAWSGTLGGVLPLLNFGRLEAQSDIADARKRQAFYAYKQAILLAVEDVEISYAGYLSAQEREQLFNDAALAQGTAANVAREQYRAGIGPQLDLLDAERNALEAELASTQAKAASAENLAQLYTALGFADKAFRPSTDTQPVSSKPPEKPMSLPRRGRN